MRLLGYFLFPALATMLVVRVLGRSGDALLNTFAIAIVVGCLVVLTRKAGRLPRGSLFLRSFLCTAGILAPIPWLSSGLNQKAYATMWVVGPVILFIVPVSLASLRRRSRREPSAPSAGA